MKYRLSKLLPAGWALPGFVAYRFLLATVILIVLFIKVLVVVVLFLLLAVVVLVLLLGFLFFHLLRAALRLRCCRGGRLSLGRRLRRGLGRRTSLGALLHKEHNSAMALKLCFWGVYGSTFAPTGVNTNLLVGLPVLLGVHLGGVLFVVGTRQGGGHQFSTIAHVVYTGMCLFCLLLL